jgi:hypothetical protein
MPGPRVFAVDEVDALIPRLENSFSRMDDIRSRLRMLTIRVNALELIWGHQVHEKGNPDHGELQQHLSEMKQAEDEVEALTKRVARMGGQVKSVDPPLVDFYGVREGRLVFWCWTRGETHVEHWHHVDQGFSNRQPV